MEFNTILLIVAIVLLAASLLVKGYGMMQLANKDLPQEERMEIIIPKRYRRHFDSMSGRTAE